MSAMLIHHQEELLHANWSVVEEERKRLSKDIHDEIGSIFSTLSLTLDRLNHSPSAAETQLTSVLSQSHQLISTGISNMRRILYDIIPLDIEVFGLSHSVIVLCDRINATGQLDIEFQERGQASKCLSKQQELTLYRIIQELLNNTLKHAAATKSVITVTWSDYLYINYCDDGVGFNKAKVPNDGLGLRNIEGRSKMISADVQFTSSAEKGMEFSLKLAYHSNE